MAGVKLAMFCRKTLINDRVLNKLSRRLFARVEKENFPQDIP